MTFTFCFVLFVTAVTTKPADGCTGWTETRSMKFTAASFSPLHFLSASWCALVHRCKQVVYVLYCGHVFYVFNVFYVPNVFLFLKNVGKVQSGTFKITATK